MNRLRRAFFLVVALLLALSGSIVAPAPQARAQSVVATIPLPFSPGVVAVNPTTHRVYVAPAPGAGQSIAVLDGESHSLVGTIAVGPGADDVAVNPITNRVYVAETSASGAVVVLDGASNLTLATIPLSLPSDLVVNPTTNRVYLAADNTPDRDLVVVDGATNAVLSHSSNDGAGTLALDPDANQLYVYNGHDELLARTDLTSNSGPEVTTDGYLNALAVSHPLNRLYLARFSPASQLSVLDATTLATVATLPWTAAPLAIAVNPTTNRVYVGNDNGTLTILDGAVTPSGTTTALVATVPVGAKPDGVAVDPTLDRVFVANAGDKSVSVIDDAAAPAPAPPVPHDGRYFPQTAFRVDNDAIWDYFVHRGGVTNFGYPVSRTFLFQGHLVQFFQRRIVELDENGHPRLRNLLDYGLLAYTRFNGATFPAVDDAMLHQSPDPTNAAAVLAFVRANAPDTFQGMPVRFYQTFATTVTAAIAFPNGGGDPNLVPGFNLEMWGIPTSQPAFDPNNHNFVYQRFERGIMMYDQTCGCTQGILLADYLKSVLTGQNLPPDLAAEVQYTGFLRQYDPSQPKWIHDPSLLPSSDLTNAFNPE